MGINFRFLLMDICLKKVVSLWSDCSLAALHANCVFSWILDDLFKTLQTFLLNLSGSATPLWETYQMYWKIWRCLSVPSVLNVQNNQSLQTHRAKDCAEWQNMAPSRFENVSPKQTRKAGWKTMSWSKLHDSMNFREHCGKENHQLIGQEVWV